MLKIWFNEIFKQFWAIIMAKLQSDRYEIGCFLEIWMEYYCLGENRGPRKSLKLSSKFFRCKNPNQLQNLKLLSTFQGHKILHGQNFCILIFLTWNDKVMQISPEQKPTWGQIIFIHKSYNGIVDKIVFISLREGQKWNLTFFGKLYLTFFFLA